MLLTKNKLCVCELRDILGITISTVSKHLSILKDLGFIIDEKDGKWVYYSLNTASRDIILNHLLLFLQINLHDEEQIKSDLEKANRLCINEVCKM